MNHLCAIELATRKIGIFRSVTYSVTTELDHTVPIVIRNFAKLWNSTGGRYVSYNNLESHDALKLDAYTHITSPIRRLVDLLNMIQLQCSLGFISENRSREQFYNGWTTEKSLEYINTRMSSIRKVQNDCAILEKCVSDPDVLTRTFTGYVIRCKQQSNGLYQHGIYLPQLKLFRTYISRVALEINSSQIILAISI